MEKCALVRHVFDCTHRKDGHQARLFILTVWMQQRDQWKLLARQATRPE